jgi:hypothetical protein
MGCMACALESDQTVNDSARCAPERPLAHSSTNKAGRSVVSWLAEGSDTGPRIARQQCESCLLFLGFSASEQSY